MLCGMEDADVRQNLRDAGCSAEFIRRFMKTWESGAVRDCSGLLDDYRRTLLDGIHLREEKLTCLDYLRYRLRKT